jgi:hypothetical protein
MNPLNGKKVGINYALQGVIQVEQQKLFCKVMFKPHKKTKFSVQANLMPLLKGSRLQNSLGQPYYIYKKFSTFHNKALCSSPKNEESQLAKFTPSVRKFPSWTLAGYILYHSLHVQSAWHVQTKPFADSLQAFRYVHTTIFT